jgi:hypothetical protein
MVFSGNLTKSEIGYYTVQDAVGPSHANNF